jgi:hypothetical protein
MILVHHPSYHKKFMTLILEILRKRIFAQNLTFRHLMKIAKVIRAGQSQKSNKIVDYLFQKGPTKCLIDQAYDTNYRNVLESFEHLARRQTLEVYDKLVQLQQQGRSYEQAWNDCAVELCKVNLSFDRKTGVLGRKTTDYGTIAEP